MARQSGTAWILDVLWSLPRDIRFGTLGLNPSPGFREPSRDHPIWACHTGAGTLLVCHREADSERVGRS
jgi:hypothetical protein